MEKCNQPDRITDNVVVSMMYTLKVDGEILDSCEENDPLLYLHGHENIIPGLERELAGLTIGATKDVTVKPQDGYGEFKPDAFKEIPRSEFPKDFPLEIGVELEFDEEDEENEENEPYFGTIVSVDDASVRVDLNHPLSGKDLNFQVKIVDLRYPTEDELCHGHVHPGEHYEGEDFGEEDCE
jgi:FKBP-type peptidyl-prolyl cis-trans isomerase SlyD